MGALNAAAPGGPGSCLPASPLLPLARGRKVGASFPWGGTPLRKECLSPRLCEPTPPGWGGGREKQPFTNRTLPGGPPARSRQASRGIGTPKSDSCPGTQPTPPSRRQRTRHALHALCILVLRLWECRFFWFFFLLRGSGSDAPAPPWGAEVVPLRAPSWPLS